MYIAIIAVTTIDSHLVHMHLHIRTHKCAHTHTHTQAPFYLKLFKSFPHTYVLRTYFICHSTIQNVNKYSFNTNIFF